MQPVQDLTIEDKVSRTQYQFSVEDASSEELREWVPKLVERLKQDRRIVDVATDQQEGGLQAFVDIDRAAAAASESRRRWSTARSTTRSASASSRRSSRRPTSIASCSKSGPTSARVPARWKASTSMRRTPGGRRGQCGAHRQHDATRRAPPPSRFPSPRSRAS
jgi:hypothetical protein